ncbi:hypothetical protein DXT63_09765 [Thermoanaerobacteraceae bacterium SP2]|nr:hypothetical protein DXT63_09765 [Thermoanaerobacteraceae bacterium SP2]
MRNKKIISLLLLCCLVLSVGFSIAYGWEFLNADKDTKTNLDDAFIEAGKYVKNNEDLLTNMGEIVATVNEVPIYKNELLYRQGFASAIGQQNNTLLDNFNALARKKVLLAFAKKENIVATEQEVQEFISKEQNAMKQSDEFRNAVELFCENAGMSMEEYWNQYEYNIAKDIVTIGKLEKYIIDRAVSEGKLPKKTEKLDKDISKQYTKYLRDYKNNLMSKAEVEIKEGFKEKLNGFKKDNLIKQ